MTQVDSQTWIRVAELFDELVELSAPERDQRLARLMLDEPLIGHEVGLLLRADSAVDGVLECSLDRISPALADAADNPPWQTTAGSQFGPYRLVEPIGEGGMGEVWLAERSDGAYRQQVALKLLKRGLDTQAILRRFLQERSILARLEHPNIVRVFDGGMSADGRPWYAMTHVLGQPIIDYAARHCLDVRARIRLLVAVADAVAYAHAHLVVHRDLKPGNILVDAEGQPHLLDFGIAKLLEDTSEFTATGTQVRVLSPAYAAPEQILGLAVSTGTDVYALGVIAYQLLTGRLPHRRSSRDPNVLAGEMTQGGPTERASHAIAHSDPAQLSQGYGPSIDRRRLARQIGGDLDLILAMALRTEPERRYAGADAFAADLRAWLEARPIAARPDRLGYRMRRFVQRHALAVSAAGLIVAALVVGLALAVWQAGIARANAARAEQQAQRAEQQAARAEATKDFVVAAFNGLDPTQTREGANLRLSDFLVSTLQRLDEAMPEAPEARIELRITLARALQELGELESARAAFAQAEREASAQVSLSPKAHGVLVHEYAINHQRRGDLGAAERLLGRSVATLMRDPADTAQERISARTTLAYLMTDRGRYREAEREYLAIRDDRRALNGIEDARLAVDWMNLCVTRWYLAEYAQAEQDCQRARQLLDSADDSPRARLAWVGNALGLVLSSMGRWEEADASFEQSRIIVEQTLSREHAMWRVLIGNRAALLLERGQLEDALELSRASIEHPGFLEGAASSRRAALSGHLAILVALTRLEEAEAVAALLNSPEHSVEAATTLAELRLKRRLAELHLRQGRLAEAGTQLRDVLEAYRDNDLHNHDDYARALLLQVEWLRANGDVDNADALHQDAWELLRERLGDEHPLVRDHFPDRVQ